MKVTFRLFAILRDRAGVSELAVDLPENASVSAARDALLHLHPELADLLKRVAFAVNQSYCPAEAELHEGDEVAFIPPVSGG